MSAVVSVVTLNVVASCAVALSAYNISCDYCCCEECCCTKLLMMCAVFRIHIQLNPDPAKKLNPDPDPSYFFTMSEKNTS